MAFLITGFSIHNNWPYECSLLHFSVLHVVESVVCFNWARGREHPNQVIHDFGIVRSRRGAHPCSLLFFRARLGEKYHYSPSDMRSGGSDIRSRREFREWRVVHGHNQRQPLSFLADNGISKLVSWHPERAGVDGGSDISAQTSSLCVNSLPSAYLTSGFALFKFTITEQMQTTLPRT